MYPGMSSGMTYVGTVDMNPDEINKFRRTEMIAELAKGDDSPSENKADVMMEYEHAANDIIIKNKKMILAAGYSETRGDIIALVTRAFDPGVRIVYRQGDWERPELKPILTLAPQKA